MGIGDASMYAVQKWIEYAQNWFSYCVIFSFSTNIDKIINGEYTLELIHNTFHQYSMNILKDVAENLVKNKISHMPVVDADNRLIGMVTDIDLMACWL